ncbi:hypothetical protein ACPZ19_45330 [Amycolatopsis lurida]
MGFVIQAAPGGMTVGAAEDRVEFVLTTVRTRLAAEGPLAENTGDDGLFRELVTSATLVPPHLALLVP